MARLGEQPRWQWHCRLENRQRTQLGGEACLSPRLRDKCLQSAADFFDVGARVEG